MNTQRLLNPHPSAQMRHLPLSQQFKKPATPEEAFNRRRELIRQVKVLLDKNKGTDKMPVSVRLEYGKKHQEIEYLNQFLKTPDDQQAADPFRYIPASQKHVISHHRNGRIPSIRILELSIPKSVREAAFIRSALIERMNNIQQELKERKPGGSKYKELNRQQYLQWKYSAFLALEKLRDEIVAINEWLERNNVH